MDDFQILDYLIVVVCWAPLGTWALLYAYGVSVKLWKRDSWKVILSFALVSTAAVSSGIALVLSEWSPALSMLPVTLVLMTVVGFLGFRLGAAMARRFSESGALE